MKVFRLMVVLLGVLMLTPVVGGAAIITDGSEPTLSQIANNFTVSPAGDSSIVNPGYAGQLGFDETWAFMATGTQSATLVIEISALSGVNSFGIYDPFNIGTQLTVFNGAAIAGAGASVTLLADGSLLLNNADTGLDLSANLFGYFFNNGVNTWYSQSALNSDGQSDHMASFQGNGTDVVQLPNRLPGVWGVDEYLLAFEDLPLSPFTRPPFGSADEDYNDFVVMVESVKPVPEPGTMMLLGSGLIGLAGWGRKKFRK